MLATALRSKAPALKHELSLERLHPKLSQALNYNEVQKFTDIQYGAIQKGLLDGKNMLLHSESGSGKTLTYLMPILNQLYNTQKQVG